MLEFCKRSTNSNRFISFHWRLCRQIWTSAQIALEFLLWREERVVELSEAKDQLSQFVVNKSRTLTVTNFYCRSPITFPS